MEEVEGGWASESERNAKTKFTKLYLKRALDRL